MPEIPQFIGAPPERRSAAAIAEERAAVTVQIGAWIQKIKQEAGVQRLLADGNAVLNHRRADLPVPQFAEDRDALVITDRVVVPAADAADACARLNAVATAREIHIRGLDDIRVLECGDLGRCRVEQRDFAGLAPAELPGKPIHMVPMGGIRKADGGPERSGPRSPEEVWTRSASTAHGPKVTVLDTGISDEQRTDGWLVGLSDGANRDELDVIEPHGQLDLGAGHGTFVAGVIQQVAPDAHIEVVKVLDSDGLGDETVAATAIVEAARREAQIINLSLGTVTADDQPPEVLKSALRAAIRLQPDVLFVCAAGNYADARPCWPAAFSGMEEFRDHVVSVAALRLDDDGGPGFVGAEWSTRGDWVTCSVPGQGVVSTYVEGTEVEQPPPLRQDTFGKASWATWSGTSFAAPQVVGAIVWTMQQAGWAGTPRQAFDAVMKDVDEVVDDYGPSISILPV